MQKLLAIFTQFQGRFSVCITREQNQVENAAVCSVQYSFLNVGFEPKEASDIFCFSCIFVGST